MKVPIQQIPVSGGHIAAYSIGRGPAIIFLHGGPGDTHHYMARMAEPLFGEFQCIFFDQRGSGDSVVEPRNKDQFRLQLLISDLLAVCQYFEVSSPMLVGHSWGAMYALFACIQYPARFDRVALLNMGPLDTRIEQKTKERLAAVFSPSERNQWEQLRKQRNLARDRGDIDEVLDTDKKLMKLRVKAWIHNSALHLSYLEDYFLDPPPDRQVNSWICENISGWFSWDKLEFLRTKLWLAVGADDSVPLEQTRIVEKIAPNTLVRIYENCGHIPWFEHLTTFYRELKSFLIGEQRGGDGS